MPRVLSSKEYKDKKIFEKTSKACHVGIHWIALTVYLDEYPYAKVSVVFRFFASFYIGQISLQQQAVLRHICTLRPFSVIVSV